MRPEAEDLMDKEDHFQNLVRDLITPETICAMAEEHPEWFGCDSSGAMTQAMRVLDIVREIYSDRRFRNPGNLNGALHLLEYAGSVFSDRRNRDSGKAFEQPDPSSCWAATQFHRGEVLWYSAFVHPDKTGIYIEDALASYERALTVYTPETHPAEWAYTQQSVAMNYIDRTEGDRAGNLSKAITCLEDSLRVYTRDDYPVEWANTMINLGSVYAQIPGKDIAENLERGIFYLRQALLVHTRATHPVTWATLQVNLGTAFQHRIRGNPADNIDETIRLYRNAMDVFNHRDFPERFAMLNSNLGNAMIRRLSGNVTENIESAITYFETALNVQSERIPPFHRAMIRLNLATACLKSEGKTRDERVRQALTLCRDALDTCRGYYPIETAMIQYTIGNALQQLSDDQTTQNLEQAVQSYRDALTVLRPESMPSENLQKNLSLAEAALKLADHSLAEQAFAEAMTSFDIIYKQNVTMEGREQALNKGAPACFRAAFSAAATGDLSAAVQRLERGKARILSGRLAAERASFDALTVPVRNIYTELTARITALEYQLDNRGLPADRFLELAAELNQSRRELDNLIDSIRMNQPEFMRNVLTLEEIRTVIPDPDTVLLEFCITENGSAVLAIMHPSRPDAQNICWTTDSFKQSDLDRIKLQYIEFYNRFKSSKKTVPDVIDFEKSIMIVLQKFYDTVFRHIDIRLANSGIRKLIISPHRFLHVLPLHLMQSSMSGTDQYLMERYTITYTPSATALFHIFHSKTSRFPSKPATGESGRLLAISNPTGDLRYADAETDTIAELFESKRILSGQNASPDRIIQEAKNADHLHFACHGIFNFSDPLQSGLVLAARALPDHAGRSGRRHSEIDTRAEEDAVRETRPEPVAGGEDSRAVFFQIHDDPDRDKRREMLFLTEISHKMKLAGTRLVVLSACDSGWVGTTGEADEVIGLPAGFLQAGADTVVSSLWLVDDAYSLDLISNFYSRYTTGKQLPSEALRCVQLDMLKRGIGPYYWGGFIVTGHSKEVIT